MMDMKNQYDVVIVGAGPAGAGAAKALTASGLETLMVERDAMPRYKMCSGVLFPGSVKTVAEDFGELPEEVFCQPREIKGNRAYITEEAPCFELSFSAFGDDESLPENGLNIRRAELDQWLCQRSDARIIDHCRFEGCEKEGDGYIIKLKHEGQELTVRSRYLVGADGTMSRVRKTAFPDFDEKIGLIPNYEEFYRGSIDLEPGWLYLLGWMSRSTATVLCYTTCQPPRIIVWARITYSSTQEAARFTSKEQVILAQTIVLGG